MKKLTFSLFLLVSFFTFSFAQTVTVSNNGGNILLDATVNGSTGDNLVVQSASSNADARTRLQVIPKGADLRAFVEVNNSSSSTDFGQARLGARNEYAILSTGNAGTALGTNGVPAANSMYRVGIELDAGQRFDEGEAFVVAKDGFIATGTPTILCKIDSDGLSTIEAKVQATVAAPDYVFKSDYNLRSLDEVEAYINENSHLPEIPSAAEFAEDGITLGKMSFDLLKKVEELTLYMIDMKKENEALKARVAELEQSK